MLLARLKALSPVLSGTSFEAFGHREYRYFWVAAAFSNIGMWTLVYGRLWLMRTLTESEWMLGLVATASLGPVLFLSMWGGVLADRVNRLYLVRFTRLMFAAVTLLTAVLIATDVIRPWHVIAISAGTGVLSVVRHPIEVGHGGDDSPAPAPRGRDRHVLDSVRRRGDHRPLPSLRPSCCCGGWKGCSSSLPLRTC